MSETARASEGGFAIILFWPQAVADREREREEQDTRSNWRPSRHDTPNYHSAKRALIDPGDSSPSRLQAYGCRACAGVFGSGGGHPTLTSPLGNPAGVTVRIGRATEGALNCT